MNRTTGFRTICGAAAAGLIFFLVIAGGQVLLGQSFDIPNKKWGLSFGNSPEFTGLRFNFRDRQVRYIRGMNVTLWAPHKDNKDSKIDGISFGLIPGGGYLRGIQVGLLGVGAEKTMSGINIGGLGIGSGEDLNGLNIGGFGLGAGNNVTGINLGGLGIGAGKTLKGINIGGLGAGAGEDIIGLNIGGLGLGAGRLLEGVNIGGFGVGSGQKLVGLTICGFGAGSQEVVGLTIGGFAIGGQVLKGIHLAGGMVHVSKGGQMFGFAASSFNFIKGSQNGLTIGIVNYAFHVKGVQIGLVNIVRDNPRYLKVLPLMNTSFEK
jgi:hypothetical protein